MFSLRLLSFSCSVSIFVNFISGMESCDKWDVFLEIRVCNNLQLVVGIYFGGWVFSLLYCWWCIDWLLIIVVTPSIFVMTHPNFFSHIFSSFPICSYVRLLFLLQLRFNPPKHGIYCLLLMCLHHSYLFWLW